MKTHINPRMITWARERAGLTVQDLASRMKKDPHEIELWEDGLDDPSYSLLEQLAYKYLKVPLAVFFFPDPPDIEDPVKKFRRLPSSERERFSSDTYQKIRLAQAYQDSLIQLLGDVKGARRIFRDVSPANLDPSHLAREARALTCDVNSGHE